MIHERICRSAKKTIRGCFSVVPYLYVAALLLVAQVSWAQDSPDESQAFAEKVSKTLSLIQAEKRTRTPAQQKIDSRYVLTLRKEANDPRVVVLPQGRASAIDAVSDQVRVDITASVSDALIRKIKRLGGSVSIVLEDYDAITAVIPLSSLEPLAEDEAVRHIRPSVRAIPQKLTTSEGDAAHSGPDARAFYNATGAGVKVGVISDSVRYLSDVQASGDLPAVTVLSNLPDEDSSGEGTAMLEIVHDLAPDAELLFATGFLGQNALAQAMIDLRAAGADVIVDDLFHFRQFPFQDDLLAQVAEDMVQDGAFYFTSAGNYGNWNDSTSSVYEGDYVGGPPLANYQSAHQYPNGLTYSTLQSPTKHIYLAWSDPIGASANDYDLFLYDVNGNLLATSNNVQDGNDQAEEYIAFDAISGDRIVIAKWSGQDRFLHLSVPAQSGPTLSQSTPGFIRGQGGAQNVFAVAATSARNRSAPFSGQESVETFSSDGPRKKFFDRFGAAYTPGDFSSSGGINLFKPNITAADGVMTSTPGFNPFYGTSAASPHAAGIAALMLSARPNLTLADMWGAFVDTALDIEAQGPDRDAGVGIIMADASLDAITGAPGAPQLDSATAGNQSATLVFTPPADDGGIPVNQYQASCDSFQKNGSASPIHVTGLTNGETYNCRVRARNAKGYGPYSNIRSVTPASDTVPEPPVLIRVVADDGAVIVYFEPSGAGGSPIEPYTVTCGSQSATGSTSPITVLGLENDIEYSCSVVATNSHGDSAPSQAESATPEEYVGGLNMILIKAALDAKNGG